MADRFVFRVLAPIPAMGLRAGDMLRLEPGAPYPIVVLRPGDPNTGRLLLEVEAGHIEPVTGCPSLDALSEPPALQPPALPHRRLGSHPRTLQFRRPVNQ